jgi:uncharacterized protein YgiM (DUF1202 family)
VSIQAAKCVGAMERMRLFGLKSARIRLGFSGAFLLLGLVAGLWAMDLVPLQAQGAGKRGTVATEDTRLNVRSGAGTGYGIVAKLDPGTEVEIISVSDDGVWYQIQASGISGPGWAAAEFIAAETQATTVRPRVGSPAATPAPGEAVGRGRIQRQVVQISLPTVTPTPAATATANNTAGNGSEPTAVVLQPTAASIPAIESAAGETVQVAAPTATPVATASVPTAITQPVRMNLRGGPSTSYNIVNSVAAGTALEITGLSPDGEWYRVKGGEDGASVWVFRSLTRAIGPLDAIVRLPQEDVPPAPVAAVQPASAVGGQETNVVAVAAPAVAAPAPTGGGAFGYGVQAHMLGGGSSAALGAVNDLGFNWIKQQVEWKLFQPAPGAAGFGELHGIVGEAGSRGINVLFSVVNAPDWAREAGFDASVGGPPADPQTYAAFVGTMAQEFCGSALKAIEVWNEQNLHYEWGNRPLNPAEYMNLLRPAYAAIKGACPSMYVISGALTPAGSNPPFAMDDFAYLEGMYQNGLANYADGIGAHPSGYNVPPSVGWENGCAAIQQNGNSFNGACDSPHHSWSFRSTMEGYRNIMVVYRDGNKKIWPTEFGWAAGGAFDPRYAYANDNSFEEQAAWTVEAYQMMRGWGWVGPAFLWNLNFRVVADGTEKAQWGIVRNDYSPLPVYEALKAMPK